MNRYKDYYTEEQTKKAFELGAPIGVLYTKDDYQQKIPTYSNKGEFVNYNYFVPTTEEMIGWLEAQGILVLPEPSQDKFYGTYSLKREDGYWFNRIFLKGLYPSRKEATLVAIDAALDYLKENKK